jgi:hypothetical protein
MGEYAGVKFADKEHIDALNQFGLCVFQITAEERKCNHPDIGDFAHLLLDETSSGRRIAVRLIAEQVSEKDGSCMCIYTPAPFIFK